jgi:hypothetical protein
MIKQLVQEAVLESMRTYFNGKTIVCVDIQPEYQSYFGFATRDWVRFLNSASRKNDIILLYNGPDLGMISESGYLSWLMENGLKQDATHSIKMFDKGYAFFRYCMDSNIDEDAIVDLVRFMMHNGVNDSRDIDEGMWNSFLAAHPHEDIKDLLHGAGDLISIPDLMETLAPLDNIMLTGGGVNECLKEVEIALKALGKPYGIIDEFLY